VTQGGMQKQIPAMTIPVILLSEHSTLTSEEHDKIIFLLNYKFRKNQIRRTGYFMQGYR
jgi:hypothetical protein